LEKPPPFVIWFTGLPCSGKTTLATRLCSLLKSNDRKVEHLDGDIVRKVFPRTGFSQVERNRHIQQMGFLASRLEEHGVCVLASFISPYSSSREFVRSSCKNFIEIYVATSVKECERRDVKGMYEKARKGEIVNFTGVDDAYESPESPDLIIDTEKVEVEESLQQICEYLKSRNLLATLKEEKE
ncbi:UNVERIFIED_CONTAM: hypothetical protein GTU68_038467, partial [Idotea baltica]|nr:hypothetical protein [Idotea baltica]